MFFLVISSRLTVIVSGFFIFLQSKITVKVAISMNSIRHWDTRIAFWNEHRIYIHRSGGSRRIFWRIQQKTEEEVSFFRKVMDETYYKSLNFGFSLVLLAAGTGTGKSVSTISNEWNTRIKSYCNLAKNTILQFFFFIYVQVWCWKENNRQQLVF